MTLLTCKVLWLTLRLSLKVRLSPFPKFKAYEAFTYNAAALRSPFQPFSIKIDLVQREKGSKEIKPDETRVKQFLEGFNIETFEMVGTLKNETGSYAL